ncbi:MAG TPA: hypothetical protein VJW20_06540 [Candidatus Angelobacter sp.]|nr:hypothetical protein [Candidatus Angelobacter sp.]
MLSQLLVAFTIEFDNEFECQMPHRTTENPSNTDSDVPWLVSIVMWSNFIQYVPEEEILASELRRRWRVDKKTLIIWLARLSKWWGDTSMANPLQLVCAASGPRAVNSIRRGVLRSRLSHAVVYPGKNLTQGDGLYWKFPAW